MKSYTTTMLTVILLLLLNLIFFDQIKEMVLLYIEQHGIYMFMSQVFISVLGVPAIYLSQSKNYQIYRLSSIAGLLGQPFWYIMAVSSDAWGVLFMSFFYTHAWWTGFRNHWLQPRNGITKTDFHLADVDNRKKTFDEIKAEIIADKESRLNDVKRNLTHLENSQLATVAADIKELLKQRTEYEKVN